MPHRDPPTQAKRVAVFRSDVLPLSETFILQQLRGLRRWQGRLVGFRAVQNGLPLQDDPPLLLHAPPRSVLERACWKAFCTAGWPMPKPLRALKAMRPDLVHVHFGTDAVAAWPWLRRLGVPVLVTLHGYDATVRPDWWRSGAGGPGMRHYPEALLAMSRHPSVRFIAVSQAIKAKAQTLYGLPPDKIDVHYIGVNVQAFPPGPTPAGERPPRVLFVGRMVEKKGLAILLEAMHHVQKSTPAAELVVVGDGPLREAMHARAAELGLNVRFMGSQPNTVVREQLDQARVFCLPSITAENGDAEGLPIVLLEAQSSGVPVVTSAHGGRDEGLVDGRTGHGFAEGDVSALAQGISQILGDEALANSMGAAAAAFIREKFASPDCASRLETIYDRAAARSR